MEKISLIALDWDGVIRPSGERYTPSKSEDYIFVPEKISLLNSIIDDNTKILFTSTWRLEFNTPGGVNVWFHSIGIKPVCVGITPHLGTYRGTEILSWLFDKKFLEKEYDVNHLVILDDDDDMGVLKPWLVRSKVDEGLTLDHSIKAQLTLKKPFELGMSLNGNFVNI